VMTPSSHVDDALSALLDGELSAEEADRVRGHLSDCAECVSELEHVQTARAWLRELPMVDPPFGFYERLLGTRRRRRWAAASVVAAAAASVAFVGSLPAREEPVDPAVATLVRTHAITASVDGDPLSQLATAGVPARFRP
jgi:anti-sigma factor RsiW